MLGIGVLVKLRTIWRRDCLGVDVLPVDAGEPGMRFDLEGVLLAAADALHRVLVQKSLAEVDSIGGQELIVQLWLSVLDILVEFLPVFRVEGRQADEHLVDNCAE